MRYEIDESAIELLKTIRDLAVFNYVNAGCPLPSETT